MLDARMVRNTSAKLDREENGNVVVKVANVRPRWMVPPLRWMVPFRPERTIHLDTLGTRVWELCDGKRTVEEVVDMFAKRHALTFHEARVSVASYMKELISRGALVVVMEPPAE